MASGRIAERWREVTRVALRMAVVVAWAGSASGADEPERLRVAVKPVPPFVYTDDSAPRGYSIDLWNEIAGIIGADTEFVTVASVKDILAAVEQGTVDAGIAAITISAEREALVDFSHPYFRSGLRVGVPVRGGPSWFATIARFFSLDLLGMFGTLAGLTLVAAHLLWLVERSVNPDCFPRGYLAGVGEAMWWSVATIITGGCENKAPVSLLGRLVAVAWMLGSIVLVASFTATLASQMTSEAVAGAISGPDDLPGRLVATVAGTSAVAEVRDRHARVRECPDLATAIREVVAGRAEAVVFDAPVLAIAVAAEPNSGLRIVGPMFDRQDYGVALPRGSHLRKAVNQALLRLAETGKLAELNARWFGEHD